MWESKREWEGGIEGGGRVAPFFLSLLIRQFMAFLFNKAIQGGEAQWTRCSRGSIAMNPRLVCMGVTYLRRGPIELSVGLGVLYRPPLWLLQAFGDFPPKTCERTERPVNSSRFHPFSFKSSPEMPALAHTTSVASREKKMLQHEAQRCKYLSGRREAEAIFNDDHQRNADNNTLHCENEWACWSISDRLPSEKQTPATLPAASINIFTVCKQVPFKV